ncbi:uncharacterized protein LOC116224637 isoform X2 [Clupea harengus]|uniref:Uncharacterized protein LOC116224637 isoform X2 n=1 Tax=Clupea harengus TaxID=7950 RepID=A0A6P8GSM5_CLUHA|nr:uncharacterized protein LOC116224637 isoform X2 [Clupea harengus]
MNLFVFCAQTPVLLIHALLFLSTARSWAQKPVMGPTTLSAITATPGGNTSLEQTSPIPTHTHDTEASSQTANSTTLPSLLNGTDTAHTPDEKSGDTGNTSLTVPVPVTVTSPAPEITTTAPKITPTAPEITITGLSSTKPVMTSSTTAQSTVSSAGGSVILIFILLAIIALGVLLYYLRKKSRSYSFDLHFPADDQASDNTPLKPVEVEMERFQPKDTDSPATLPSEVNDCAANHLGVANGGVEEGPGETAITLDSRSSESDEFVGCGDLSIDCLPKAGSQIDCVPEAGSQTEDTSHVNVEEQSGNENNNNFTVVTKGSRVERTTLQKSALIRH